MTEDWKGEHHIRGKRTGIEEVRRITNLMFHQQRRELGLPPAGKKAHDLAIGRTFKKGKKNVKTPAS